MSSLVARWLAIVLGVVVVALAIGLYVNKLVRAPAPVSAQQTGPAQAQLTLGTTPAVGKLGGHPTWVSYLVREGNQWKHTTTFDVPSNSLVRITILNFDGASGLRNPFLSQVQGTVGGTMQLNGKTVKNINPDDASHTFSVPQMGIVVPLQGVPDDAANPCEEMPCSLSQDHETITFMIRTGKKGWIRWQCFVPCAAGFFTGFGGPMQTIGYMDGFLHVV
ncbi:MAG: hypothetical protein WA696_17200 [Solirubrobacterales bacterium]